jgi:sulfur carrier protein ThiS adenylyltransferase
MNIHLNERPHLIPDGTTVGKVACDCKADADIFILNSFPTTPETVLQPNDRLVIMKRGERPSPEEIDALLAARHSPGVHARLKSCTVGIAGCGGLGSNAAVSLARMGIGRLIVVDFDVVEPSNLNRQQFFVDQIGLPKAQALQETLLRINPRVHVEAMVTRVTSDNVRELFQSADLVIEAFDRADQKAMLADSLSRLFPQKPLILGLGVAGYGFNQLLHTRRSGNLSVCGDEISEAGPHFGLMAPRVAIVANLQANLALEILLGPDPCIQAHQGALAPRSAAI